MLTKIQKVPIKLLLTLVFILLANIVFLLRLRQKPESVEAGWWNDSWHYRQPISIGWTGTALTDFQISVDIGTSALVNDGKMQTDCDDIRFTDQFGNLIPHWIEENNPGCNASTDTKIWLKPSSIPQNGTTIYLYYGNSSASNSESGIDVFNFFDGFDGSSLDSKWTALETGYTNVSNSFLEIDRTSLNTQIAAVYPSLSESIIEFKGIQLMESYSYRNRFYFGTFDGSTFSQSNPGGGDYGFFQDGSGTDETEIYHNGWRNISLNTTDLFSIKHVLRGSVVDSYYQNQSASTTIYTATGLTPTINNSSINSIELAVTEATTSHFKIDTVLVRKYSSSEPTFSLIGSEEKGTGPIAYWDFNEAAGSTAHDIITNNHGSISTPNWKLKQDCNQGNCLYNSTTTIPDSNSLDISDELTVSMWWKPTALHTGYANKPILKQTDTSDSNFNLYYFGDYGGTYPNNQGNLTFYANRGGTWGGISGTYKVTSDDLNNWMHIALTYTSALGGQLYINGKPIGSKTGSGVLATNNQPIYIGDANSYYDEVKIFDYALTPDQIKVEYNRGAGVAIGTNQKDSDPGTTNLVAEWKFEEGVGTTAYDTGGTNPISLTNTSWTNGMVGKAIGLNGTSSEGNANGSYTLDSGFTIQATIYPLTTDRMGIIKLKSSGGSCASSCDTAFIYVSSGYWTFVRYYSWGITGKAWNCDDSECYLDTNEWHQLSIVVSNTDQNNVDFYINGRLVSSLSSADTTWGTGSYPTTSNAGLQLGAEDTWRFFNGKIDHVKIWNTALTPDQIAFEYNQAGPIAHYRLDEGYGTTTHDSGSSSYDASITSPAWTNTGKLNKSLGFDGTNTDLILPATLGNPTTFGGIEGTMTFSMWLYVEDDNTQVTIMHNLGGAWAYFGLNASSVFQGMVYNCTDSVNYWPTSNSAIPLNTWTHVVSEFSGSGYKFYINGMLDRTVSEPKICFNNSGTPHFGQDNIGWTDFKGKIDDLKIFNYALTDDEVKIEYNRGSALALGVSQSSIDVGTTNLVAEWKFEEGVGTTAYDTSTNSSHLSLSNTSWTSGKYGKSLAFNGSSSVASVTDNPNISLTNTGTISAWVYSNRQYPSDDGTTKFREIINKWTGGSCSGSDEGYFLDWYGTDTTATLRGYICNGTTSQGITKSSTTFTPNTWNLITYVWNGTSHQLYINGSSIGSTVAQTINNQDDSGTLKIGSGFGSWDGKIDHVKIWNTALTPAQIAWEYNQGAPIGHWRLDEKSGSIAYDSSGLGNTGALGSGTSSPTWTTGKLNNAASFDGTNDHIQIPHNTSLNLDAYTQSYSISLWLKSSATSATLAPRLIEKWNSSGGYPFSFQIQTDYSNMSGVVYDGTNVPLVQYGDVFDNTWHHIVFIVNNTQDKIFAYDNGIMVDEVNNTVTSSTANTSSINIANSNVGFNRPFDGLIDDVRIYNYALTPDQVKNLYNGGAAIKFN